MQKKKIATLLAASAIFMNCSGITANAQTVKNTQDYNLSVCGVNVNENVTLSSGKQIRAVISSGELVIEEKAAADADQWLLVDNIGKAALKDIVENSTGGYTVTYIKDNFKYTRVYDKDSSKVEDEKMVGVEVLNYDDVELTLDLIVDEINNETAIITPNGNEVVKNFIPTLATYLGDANICMIGKDKNDKTSVIIVTKNKRVVQSKDVAAILGSEYSEVRAIGGIEVDDEKFILSGYAVKADDPSKKDGFVVQFDGEGNRDKNASIKILPASADNKYDASIKIVIRSENGNMLLIGDNIGRIYINALDYNDPRIVKESLKLAGGKTYQVVESQAVTYSTNKTYTVKCIDGDFQYDIETYENVKGIKLVPGNDDQLLVAVQKENDTTEIGIIDTKAEVRLDHYGDVIGMITNGTVIQNTDGPILNIDLNNIKVDGNGQVVVNKNGESDSQEVTLDGVKPGNPIEVTPDEPSSPEKPDEPVLPDTPGVPVIPEEPDDEVVTPPGDVEEEKPSDPDNQPPSDSEETPDDGDKEETPEPPVEGGEEETPNLPEDGGDTESKPEVPGEPVLPDTPQTPVKPQTPVTPIKPVNNVQVVNIDNGEKVTFDVAKPKNIKIVSGKLTNKEIQYIVVNGVKITKPSMARVRALDTIVDYNDEYYTVTDGGIVLFAKLFDTLKQNSNGIYDIGAAFTDGEKIENLTRISMIDTSSTVNDSKPNVSKPNTGNSINKGDSVDKENKEESNVVSVSGASNEKVVYNATVNNVVTTGNALENTIADTAEEDKNTENAAADNIEEDTTAGSEVENKKDSNNQSVEAKSEKTSNKGLIATIVLIGVIIASAVGAIFFKKKE